MPAPVRRSVQPKGKGAMSHTYKLPIKLVSTMNAREHWATKAKRMKAQRGIVRLTMCTHPVRLPCIVTITRISPRPFDGDNFQAATKAIRDGVADVLGVPDNSPAIYWMYAQRKGRIKEHAVEIEVKAMAAQGAA